MKAKKHNFTSAEIFAPWPHAFRCGQFRELAPIGESSPWLAARTFRFRNARGPRGVGVFEGHLR